MAKKILKMIDLFAGCGGLSLGLEQAGFTPWFVNEIVEQFANTYKFNHQLSDDHYFIGDIAELNKHIDEYKEMFADITLVCGGPPCQGFSMANRQRILDDPRNGLYKQYLIFLSHVRPQFFIMENVKGMMNKKDEIIQNFKEYLGDEYAYDYAVLKAQDFGVPQNRERFIMIGNRMGISPKAIFDEINKHKRESFVLRDALYGLPHLESKKEKGQSGIEDIRSGLTERDFDYPHTDFYKFINGDRVITKLYNHKNRYNNERDIEIYRRLPQGANSLHESIADIMPYKRRNEIFKDKYFGSTRFRVGDTAGVGAGSVPARWPTRANVRGGASSDERPVGRAGWHGACPYIGGMPYPHKFLQNQYFKLDESQICKTITSHMKFDCNMYIHPWEARGLSPREAARIQTFPDDYVITGSQNMWYAQVGNAVPVKLAKAIGDGIMKFV